MTDVAKVGKPLKPCRVEIFTIGEKPEVQHWQTVGEIVDLNRTLSISYEYDGKRYVYKGKEIGEGHWVMQVEARDWVDWTEGNTLHKIPGSVIYEGYWKTDKYGHGFWRVTVL